MARGFLSSALWLLPARIGFSSGLESLENLFEEELLRHRTLERITLINYGLGHGKDAVFSGEVGEFGGLNAIGANEFVLVTGGMGPKAARQKATGVLGLTE